MAQRDWAAYYHLVDKCAPHHEMQTADRNVTSEAYPLQDDLFIFIHPITAIYLSWEEGQQWVTPHGKDLPKERERSMQI